MSSQSEKKWAPSGSSKVTIPAGLQSSIGSRLLRGAWRLNPWIGKMTSPHHPLKHLAPQVYVVYCYVFVFTFHNPRPQGRPQVPPESRASEVWNQKQLQRPVHHYIMALPPMSIKQRHH